MVSLIAEETVQVPGLEVKDMEDQKPLHRAPMTDHEIVVQLLVRQAIILAERCCMWRWRRRMVCFFSFSRNYADKNAEDNEGAAENSVDSFHLTEYLFDISPEREFVILPRPFGGSDLRGIIAPGDS